MSDLSLYFPFMEEAVALARQGRFTAAPNPCVGAVVVRDGVVVGRGFHQRCGEAHAEVNALADARSNGVDPAGCDLVVTLEPCAHHGKTPPCVEAILEAGIRRVVIGAMDPTAEASGGAAILRDKGLDVITGVLAQDCADLIADFVTWQTTDLPYTILKLAATLDGRIATRTGHSRWISSEETRYLVHRMRAKAGAVIIGGNTFYLDNPRLTARTGDPDERQPLAVVVTSRLPEPDMACRLLQDRPQETIFWTTVAAAASRKASALRDKGVRVLGLPSLANADGMQSGMRAELDLRPGLTALRQDAGCLYTLCEGGGRLGLSLLHKGLAGELNLHLSPRILADNEATPLFTGMSPMQITDGLALRITATRCSGGDLLVSLRSDAVPAGTAA